MDKLSLEYKTFISILGIIIITFCVYLIFKDKPIREGIPPFTIPPDVIVPNMLTDQVQDAKTQLNFMQTNIKGTVDSLRTNAITISRAAAAKAQTAAIAAKSQATAMKNAAASKAIAMKNAAASKAIAMKNAASSKAIAMKNTASIQATSAKNTAALEAKSSARHAKTGKSIFSIIGRFFSIFKKVFMVFAFLGSVFIWCFQNITCGLEMFMNFRQCFFWYLLEIIGQTLYLPIRFLVWILGIRTWEKYTWDKIQAIDCAFYDLTGIHLIHYSDDILKRCYKCNPGPFPKWNIDLKVDLSNPLSLLTGFF
jgi:hypothetical protein